MKYINNETINHFRKFLSRLYKKGDESLLNRKKKREETKQKSKMEKVKINNMNNMNPYNNYYQGMYLPPPPLQINNQNPAYFNEYQNIYYLNPQAYPIPPGMVPHYLPPQYMFPPKNLEDSINAVYERGIVNNIIAAFFIKECQDKMKNNGKRKVPVSTVDLNNNDEIELIEKWIEPNPSDKKFNIKLKDSAPHKFKNVFEEMRKRYLEKK